MTRNIVVIQGHPDPDPARLCRALASAYVEGARQAGHQVQLIELCTLDFDLLRSAQDFNHGNVPASLLPALHAIQSADHLLLVFPLWLGTLPALLKGFLEQVLRPKVAFVYGSAGGVPKKLLAGKSARLVVTMGMPALIFRWWYGAHGIRGIRRNILQFVGFKPVRTTLLGMAEAASAARREDWLKKLAQLGRQAS